MSDIVPAIKEAFQSSQSAVGNHRTSAFSSQRSHRDASNIPGGEDAFFANFVRCSDRILTSSRRDLTGTRLTDFVAEYAKSLSNDEDENEQESEDEMAESFYSFIEQLIQRYKMGFHAPNTGVRFQSVRLVSRISPYAAISDAFFAEISRSAVDRLKDADPYVRNQAVILVSSLELTDETRSALIDSMKLDPSSEVRLVATYNIAHDGQDIIESIVNRIRDSSAVIRRAMYAKISKSIDMRHLTIKSRVKIVQSGLSDRDESVRKAASSLVAGSWVAKHNNNVAVVLEKLDPVANTDVADLVLRTFFEMRRDIVDKLAFPSPKGGNDESILDYGFTEKFFENSWVDDVSMLRGFQEFCVRERLNEQLEAGMPELFILANEIEELVLKSCNPDPAEMAELDDPDEWLENLPFMIEQSLLVASRYDLDDEAGRQRITTVTNNIITSSQAPTERMIEHIVAIQRRLNASSDTAFVSWAFETLTSIPQATASQLTTTEMQNSSMLTDMLRAVVLFRSVLALVSSPDLAVYSPSIFEEHLEEPLQSPFPEIRVPALECLALATSSDETFAEQHFEELFKSASKGSVTLEEETLRKGDDLLIREASTGVSSLVDLVSNSDRTMKTTEMTSTSNDNILGNLTNHSNNTSHRHGSHDSAAANDTHADSTICTPNSSTFPYSHSPEVEHLLMSLSESKTPKSRGTATLNLSKLILSGRVVNVDQVSQSLLTSYFSNEPYQAKDDDVALMQQQFTSFLRAFTLYDHGKHAIAAIFKTVCDSFSHAKARHNFAATLGSIFTHFLDLTTPGPSPELVYESSAHASIAKDSLSWTFTARESAVRRAAANSLSKVELQRTSVESLEESLTMIEDHSIALDAMTATMRTALSQFQDRLLTTRENLETALSKKANGAHHEEHSTHEDHASFDKSNIGNDIVNASADANTEPKPAETNHSTTHIAEQSFAQDDIDAMEVDISV